MKIHASALIEKAASKDAGRKALSNACLDQSDPGNPVMVATNGLIMAVIPVSDLKDGERGYVATAALKRARKLAIGDLAEITIAGENSRTFTTRDGAVMPQEVDELNKNFPNWRQVVPKPDRKVTARITFNPTLLLDLAQALGAGKGVTLEILDETSAVVVRPSCCGRGYAPKIPSAFGMMMPIAPRKEEVSK